MGEAYCSFLGDGVWAGVLNAGGYGIVNARGGVGLRTGECGYVG